jgi:hypothetical protein
VVLVISAASAWAGGAGGINFAWNNCLSEGGVQTNDNDENAARADCSLIVR